MTGKWLSTKTERLPLRGYAHKRGCIVFLEKDNVKRARYSPLPAEINIDDMLQDLNALCDIRHYVKMQTDGNGKIRVTGFKIEVEKVII